MIEIEEMNNAGIADLLRRVGYGHLGCSLNGVPYVIPVHFAYDHGRIVVYTTEGKKSAIIAENPAVCLQAEEVIDNRRWESVIVNGTAERLVSDEEREAALGLITTVNPTLTPAVSVLWLDNWVRENIEVIYRIVPERTSGRRAVSVSNDSTAGVPFDRSTNAPIQ